MSGCISKKAGSEEAWIGDKTCDRSIGLLSLVSLSLWYRYNPSVHVGLRQFVELLIFLPASGNAEATIRDDDDDDVWAACSKGLEEKALDWNTSSLSLRSSMHGNCTQPKIDRCTR